MKSQILIALLIVSMLLFGCTQTQDQVKVNDTNNQTPADTNTTADTQTVEQQVNDGWINENEVVDVGSAI